MKKILVFIITACCANAVASQDINKDLATAKSSYASNKLEDAHFALQQALSEVDIITGKKVLRILPTQMGTLNANTKEDNVFSNVGFVGATIHRTWGQGTQTVDLDIIDNSPLIGMVNTFLNMPFGGMMNSDKSKTTKIEGYKARMNNDGPGTNGSSNFSYQIPLSAALITFKVSNRTESQALALANTLPLDDIAKLIQ